MTTTSQVDSILPAMPAALVPANYTGKLQPDLSAVELARWWVAFQSDHLQQVLRWASSEPPRFTSQNSLPPVCYQALLSSPLAPQTKHHLNRHARQQHLAETAKIYFDLALIKESLGIIDRQIGMSEQLLRVVNERYEEGEIGRADVLLAESAITKQRALKDELVTEWSGTSSRLRSLVGFAIPPEQLDCVPILSFPKPLLIDLGEPSAMLSRHHDLLALSMTMKSPQNAALSATALGSCYQDRIDQYYAKVEASSNQLEPLANERSQLVQTTGSLLESYELTLEQYVLGRTKLLDVLKVQELLQEAANRLAANYHQYLIAHLEMYSTAGGGDAEVAAGPNRVAKLRMTANSDKFLLPVSRGSMADVSIGDVSIGDVSLADVSMAVCSLSAPADANDSSGQIVLLPPRERYDELGKGTVTIFSLGSPLTSDKVQPASSEAPPFPPPQR